jgi:UDP-N-acetylmuramoyl-tripeptide--D-alanyl-D-alanine ligase
MDDFEKKLLEELLARFMRMEIRGISIDSRNIKAGELFVAIKGDRFDGHDFVQDAINKGAWGAVVERAALENKFASLGGLKNILAVEDTLYALQEMSHMHRKKFSIPVVGITGSNGKTTTKEMLAGIMKQKGPVLKNEGNLNNHIGVPLTLLKIGSSHVSAVVEMGMSAPGEIDTLARLIGPTIGLITNVGPAHLEFFGSMDLVAKAKGELLDNLGPDGAAVLNVDDRFFELLKSKFSGRIVTFGIENKADVQALDIRQDQDYTDFKLSVRGRQGDVRLRAIGRYNVYNALAAAAAAAAAGMPLDAIQRGLGEFIPVAMRSEIKKVRGRTVLADYYNANPASMEAALATVTSLKKTGQVFAVLGDMLELGAASVAAHRAVGSAAARFGVDIVITVGELSKQIAEGARAAGLPGERVHETENHAKAAALLRTLSHAGDIILIKGSRGMKMEKILEEF